MKTRTAILGIFVGLSVMGGASGARAAEDATGEVHAVAGNIHVAVVEDRNAPFLVGDDSVLLAETNFARNAETLQSLIASVTEKPVRLIVNSHWHPDHVGGNAFFVAQGALTLAQESTRTRLIERQQNQAIGPQQAEEITDAHLPAMTFKSEMTIHWDSETIDLVFYPDAHTDSDVVMYYRNSNVVYVGGLMNYPMYAGVFGVPGYLDALDHVIAASDENTKIIPWRGPVVGKSELAEWRNVLSEVSQAVSSLMAEGKGIEEIVAAVPSREFDAKWGNQRAPEQFVNDVYVALSNGRK